MELIAMAFAAAAWIWLSIFVAGMIADGVPESRRRATKGVLAAVLSLAPVWDLPFAIPQFVIACKTVAGAHSDGLSEGPISVLVPRDMRAQVSNAVLAVTELGVQAVEVYVPSPGPDYLTGVAGWTRYSVENAPNPRCEIFQKWKGGVAGGRPETFEIDSKYWRNVSDVISADMCIAAEAIASPTAELVTTQRVTLTEPSVLRPYRVRAVQLVNKDGEAAASLNRLEFVPWLMRATGFDDDPSGVACPVALSPQYSWIDLLGELKRRDTHRARGILQ